MADTKISALTDGTAPASGDLAPIVRGGANYRVPLGTMAGEAATDYATTASLATVATTGDYDDLSNKPTLGTAAAVDVIDEDSMATDSATRPPSQQSVKAYVDAEVAGAGGGALTLQSVDVAVSSAEILDLNTTPKELVAAPGAGKALVFHSAHLFLDYNSVAYANDAGATLVVEYENAQVLAQIQATGFFNQTSDQYRALPPFAAIDGQNINQAIDLQLSAESGEMTTGNSPMGVRVFYYEVDLTDLSAT